MEQYGHGDLYLRRIEESDVPDDVRAKLEADSGRREVVLAEGEVTGHKHLLTSDEPIGFATAEDGRAFVLLRDAGLLTHEEHGTRTPVAGWYEMPLERDYDPSEYEREVVD